MFCFLDEHGNWFTYSFDEQSVGTAQALGSSRAINEMFSRRRNSACLKPADGYDLFSPKSFRKKARKFREKAKAFASGECNEEKMVAQLKKSKEMGDDDVILGMEDPVNHSHLI